MQISFQISGSKHFFLFAYPLSDFYTVFYWKYYCKLSIDENLSFSLRMLWRYAYTKLGTTVSKKSSIEWGRWGLKNRESQRVEENWKMSKHKSFLLSFSRYVRVYISQQKYFEKNLDCRIRWIIRREGTTFCRYNNLTRTKDKDGK